MPTVNITVITGQDESYLADFLFSKGYRVIGGWCALPAQRGSSAHIISRMLFTLLQGDLHDQSSLVHLFEEFTPWIRQVRVLKDHRRLSSACK